jgi:hypothetical protein
MIPVIPFSQLDHVFCEHKMLGFEYLNTISSLILTITGLYGLSHKKNNEIQIALYGSFIVNGFGSVGYHSTNSIGWGLIDRMSMILIACNSLNLCLREIQKKYRHIRDNRFILLNVLIQLFTTTMMTFCGLHEEMIFNILFGIFFVFLAVFVKNISSVRANNPIPIRKAQFGVICLITGALIWVVTEAFCEYVWQFHGHAFWHLCCAIGGYHIISITDTIEYEHIV